MQNDIPWQLLEKYFAIATDENENEQVKEWLGSAAENAMILEQLQAYYKTTGGLPVEFLPNTRDALHKVSEKIANKPVKSTSLFKLSSIWWKAAAVLLLLFTTWWILNNQINKPMVIVSLITTNTSVDSIILVDGSRIWLNSGSEIRYPKKFDSLREVYLKGEAYFEIAHDSKHPFIIHSENTQTQVLGTKFNLRSYPVENSASVIVTEGKVSFGNVQDHKVLLTQGQKGTLDKQTGRVVKTDNDNPNFLAWKTKIFLFDSQSLEAVFKVLSEVYHFTHRFENVSLQQRKLTAKFTQRPLDEIIQSIAIATNLNISFKNNECFITTN